jgi:hypothetical protein
MKKILYRLLRNDMVLQMRLRGFTWSKINTVLAACGQKVVTHYIAEPKGMRIYFGMPAAKRAGKIVTDN